MKKKYSNIIIVAVFYHRAVLAAVSNYSEQMEYIQAVKTYQQL